MKCCKVLCLGMSYPDIGAQIAAEGYRPDVLETKAASVHQVVECVRRRILTEMDGRDLARCIAMEQKHSIEAFTVSQEHGSVYVQERHLSANFNRSGFVDALKGQFGADVKFRQVILDYFWIPKGTWVMEHWSKRFFHKILPDLVQVLDFPKQPDGKMGHGIIYLPFCFHCMKELVANLATLKDYFQISFVYKKELAENALWSGTNNISPEVMQEWLGKHIQQEEIYCTFGPQDVYEGMEDSHVTKDEVIDVLRRIENFSQVRMIRLRPLAKHCKNKRCNPQQPTEGGFFGLEHPSKIQNGFIQLAGSKVGENDTLSTAAETDSFGEESEQEAKKLRNEIRRRKAKQKKLRASNKKVIRRPKNAVVFKATSGDIETDTKNPFLYSLVDDLHTYGELDKDPEYKERFKAASNEVTAQRDVLNLWEMYSIDSEHYIPTEQDGITILSVDDYPMLQFEEEMERRRRSCQPGTGATSLIGTEIQIGQEEPTAGDDVLLLELDVETVSIAAEENPPPYEIQEEIQLEEDPEESDVTAEPGQSPHEFATEEQTIAIETEHPPIRGELYEQEDARVNCAEEEVGDQAADRTIALEHVQPKESTEEVYCIGKEMPDVEQDDFFVKEHLEGSSSERTVDTANDLRASDKQLQECHAMSTLEVTDEENHDEQDVLHDLQNEELHETEVELIVAGIMAQESEGSFDTVAEPMREEAANQDFQEFTLNRQPEFADEMEVVVLTQEAQIEAIAKVDEPQAQESLPHKQKNPSEILNMGFKTMEQSKDAVIDHEAMIAIAQFQKRDKELEMCISRKYDERQESRRDIVVADDRSVALEARHEMNARVPPSECPAEREAERQSVNAEDVLRAEQTSAEKDYKRRATDENRAASPDEAPADDRQSVQALPPPRPGRNTEPLPRRTVQLMDDRRPPDSENDAELRSARRVNENAEVSHPSTTDGHFNDDAGMRLPRYSQRGEAPDADSLDNMSEPGDHLEQRGSTYWHQRKESDRFFGPSRYFHPHDRIIPPPRQDLCDGMQYELLRYEQHLDPPSRRREMSSAGRQHPSFQRPLHAPEIARIVDVARMKQRQPEYADERRQPVRFSRAGPPKKRHRQIDERRFQPENRSKEYTPDMYPPPGRDEFENQRAPLSKQSVMDSNRTHGYSDAFGVHPGKRVRFSHNSDEEHAGSRITVQGAPRYEKNRNVKSFVFRSEKLTGRPPGRELDARIDDASNSRFHGADERLGSGRKSWNAQFPPIAFKGKRASGRDLTLTEIRDRGFKFLECDDEEEQPTVESQLDSFDLFSVNGDEVSLPATYTFK